MDFDQVKLGKKGSSNIAERMTELSTAIIVVVLLSFFVITMIIVFMPLLQTKAEEAQNATSNTAVASLWGIIATDGVLEILAVSVYILIVVFVFLNILKKSMK